jgi:hypothetical protein
LTLMRLFPPPARSPRGSYRAARRAEEHSMRKLRSYVNVHGQERGAKLYRLLQREANLASQIAKLKKRLAAAAAASSSVP